MLLRIRPRCRPVCKPPTIGRIWLFFFKFLLYQRDIHNLPHMLAWTRQVSDNGLVSQADRHPATSQMLEATTTLTARRTPHLFARFPVSAPQTRAISTD